MRRRVLEKHNANVWDGTVASSFDGGDGNSNRPYIISNPSQLAYFVNQIMGTKSVCVKIINDLDLNNIEWKTVATKSLHPTHNTCIDGGGHLISNLKLIYDRSYCGLFPGYGLMELQNLGVTSGQISNFGNTALGTFVGRVSGGFVKNCFSRANVTADGYYSGGIVGYGPQSDDTGGGNFHIENCYFAGTMSGVGNKSGIVSVKSDVTTILNCWNNSTTNPSQNGHSYNAPNKTGSEMKSASFVSQLGAAYETDTKNKNAGYPVLKTY